MKNIDGSMGFIKKCFKREPVPPFDLKKAVGKYLLDLPRCSKNVVIVSPDYGETHYTCEIVVAAEDLLPWAERHADSAWCSDQEEQAARKALPLWLRGAKTEDASLSYVPYFMYKVILPYVLNFVNDGITNIYCSECQSLVNDIKMETLNEKTMVDWSWWTDTWICPEEHQLYYEEHELYVYRRR